MLMLIFRLVEVKFKNNILEVMIYIYNCRFVLAAVSPAVVVPCMLALQEKGLGVDKGIPTLVIAAASVDDVLAISGFGVVLGMAFSQGKYCSIYFISLCLFSSSVL